MKRKILFIKFLVLIASVLKLSGQDAWQVQNSPIEENLVSVWFIDSLNGWIASEDGVILHTTNSGKSWQQLTVLSNFKPTKMVFINSNKGWVAGKSVGINDSICIMRTQNGGENWEAVLKYPYYWLNDIFFINDTLGWTAGWELAGSDTMSLIMHTVDGGDTWQIPQGPRILDELYSIHFRDTDYGDACGKDGVFFLTNNGGLNELSGWAMNISIPSYELDLYDIYNAGDDYGCAVGEGGVVLFTKDKWANHLKYNTPGEDTLMAVTGKPDGTGYWAAGKNGCLVGINYSIFGVTLMEDDNRITTNDLNDILAINEHYIWTVGENGTILFYGAPLTGFDNPTLSGQVSVFPNPTFDKIHIESDYRLIKQVSLLTIDGREILILTSPIPSNSIEINTSDLPEGIYLVMIANQVRKIIIRR